MLVKGGLPDPRTVEVGESRRASRFLQVGAIASFEKRDKLGVGQKKSPLRRALRVLWETEASS